MPQKPSIGPLSMQCATRDILCGIPACTSLLWKAEYQEDRKAKHAEEFLDGFSGWLHADRYQGYHKLPERIRVVGCAAHARRKFDEALTALPKEQQQTFRAAEALCYFAKLFQLEQSFAELKPEDIDYINVHGTSTPVGDVSEVKAIKDVFGDHAYKLNISSTKSMTGHLLGAAGAVEAIASVLAVKNDIVPPTINHEEGDNDENIDYNLNFTFNEAQKRTVNAALSNTFGFGGHNACVIVKKYAE